MLRYKIGNEPYYDNDHSKLYPVSTPGNDSFVEIEDDILPSFTWDGTCEKSKAAAAVSKALHQRKVARAAKLENIARGIVQKVPGDPELEEVRVPPPFRGHDKKPDTESSLDALNAALAAFKAASDAPPAPAVEAKSVEAPKAKQKRPSDSEV